MRSLKIKSSMKLMKKKLQKGATMVEYAIMVALFAVALIVVVTTMKDAVQTGFQKVADEINAAASS